MAFLDAEAHAEGTGEAVSAGLGASGHGGCRCAFRAAASEARAMGVPWVLVDENSVVDPDGAVKGFAPHAPIGGGGAEAPGLGACGP